MLAYILGEEVLQKSKVLERNWNSILDDEALQELSEELK